MEIRGGGGHGDPLGGLLGLLQANQLWRGGGALSSLGTTKLWILGLALPLADPNQALSNTHLSSGIKTF